MDRPCGRLRDPQVAAFQAGDQTGPVRGVGNSHGVRTARNELELNVSFECSAKGADPRASRRNKQRAARQHRIHGLCERPGLRVRALKQKLSILHERACTGALWAGNERNAMRRCNEQQQQQTTHAG